MSTTAVPTSVLLDLLDPFACPPWDGMTALNAGDIDRAVANGDLHPCPVRDADYAYPHIHVMRIAWLVRNWGNDGADPPMVEVLPDGRVVMQDGYHRICAAIFRGDHEVLLEIGGFLDVAETVFGVRIPS